MDKLTFLGLLVAFASILTGQFLDGGKLDVLFQLNAFLIVFCGTLGAVMLQSSSRIFMTALRMGAWVITPPKSAGPELVAQLTEWCAIARKEGMLALEARIEGIEDPFMKKGVQLLVDGHSAEKIREVLEVDIESWEQLRWQGARVWEAAGGYSPTIGIIGAVLGLMHVMQNLSEPGKLGGGIAVAFVATIYGVSFANLLFLPVANKLKAIIMNQTNMRDMVVDGLSAIANGENPRYLDIKLSSYLN